MDWGWSWMRGGGLVGWGGGGGLAAWGLGVVVAAFPLSSASPPPISLHLSPSSHPTHPTSAMCAQVLGLYGRARPHVVETTRPCSQFCRPRSRASPKAGIAGEDLVDPPKAHTVLPIPIGPQDTDGANVVRPNHHVLDLQGSAGGDVRRGKLGKFFGDLIKFFSFNF